jgi:hypothetical protein
MTDDRIPWRVGVSHCGAYTTTGTSGAPQPCTAAVRYAGVVLRREPLAAWLAFSCQAHRGELIAARRLLPRDRAVLADWQKREQGALAGEGWHPPRPLAVGAAAHELVQRAEAAAG